MGCMWAGPGWGTGLTRRRAPQDGCTPLFAAAFNGHLPVVRYLEEVGADINKPNKVRGAREEGVGRKNGVVVLWGLQQDC